MDASNKARQHARRLAGTPPHRFSRSQPLSLSRAISRGKLPRNSARLRRGGRGPGSAPRVSTRLAPSSHLVIALWWSVNYLASEKKSRKRSNAWMPLWCRACKWSQPETAFSAPAAMPAPENFGYEKLPPAARAYRRLLSPVGVAGCQLEQ